MTDLPNTQPATNWRNALETLIAEYTADAHEEIKEKRHVPKERRDYHRGRAQVYREVVLDLQQMLNQEIPS